MAVKQHDDLRAVGRGFAARLDEDLPDHLEVEESEDFLTLRCTLCTWCVVFSSSGPTMRELATLVAEEHAICEGPMLGETRERAAYSGSRWPWRWSSAVRR